MLQDGEQTGIDIGQIGQFIDNSYHGLPSVFLQFGGLVRQKVQKDGEFCERLGHESLWKCFPCRFGESFHLQGQCPAGGPVEEIVPTAPGQGLLQQGAFADATAAVEDQQFAAPRCECIVQDLLFLYAVVKRDRIHTASV